MAVRPVYVAKEKAPFFEIVNVEFEWNGGFAKVQKQKNIKAIHEGFTRKMPNKKVLEISSKSMQDGGEALSAFFLPKYVPALEKSVPVECVYQSGKVFEKGGPYTDLLTVTPKEAKRDERLKNSGKLVQFCFDGKGFPLIPRTIFYDYIYINALFENKELAKVALEYDAFTDIEFNPEKGLNSQAKAAATFVALSRMGLVEKVKDFSEFIGLYGVKGFSVQKVKLPKQEVQSPICGTISCVTQETKVQKEETNVEQETVAVGSMIEHKMYGRGIVKEVQEGKLKIYFEKVGEKTLGLKWCLTNCKIK